MPGIKFGKIDKYVIAAPGWEIEIPRRVMDWALFTYLAEYGKYSMRKMKKGGGRDREVSVSGARQHGAGHGQDRSPTRDLDQNPTRAL
ncbi:uncharacterized protein FSUBG_4926 [Fusarium subglutinans]|uniref:Uncharacterized protein n=1 Tax=Gibberella subglutinans TaxID=42677 RepID=A0A8H5V248_GIBSU|nr:uncharacterized protein FSUBG_4926 [Fusarium subglutinans]KAF5608102.1 hypothetical protein FSUBG_4926 [Fusarium subglutinans]